ncbi:MAG: hypothetical protein K2I38_01675, partial [Duncaniella sp.]|nr:hypothetical protein [Duncaniella sp.]
GVYHTDGKWVTVTIPFNTFSYNYEETATANPITGPESFGGITLCLTGGTIDADQPAPIVRIDNIRAVKNL